MKTTEIITIIISILIFLSPFIYKKYFRRPKIDISIKWVSGQQVPLYLSVKNDLNKPISPNAIIHYQLTWNYNLFIKNNSNQTAYDLELFIYKGENINFHEKIDKTTPILGNSQIEIDINYSKSLEGTGKVVSLEIKKKHPLEIKNLRLSVKYKNEKRITFYTLFYLEDDQTVNKYLFFKPKDFGDFKKV